MSDSDSDEEIKPIGQLDQLMRRQNAGVLSSNRAKVRAIEEEDEDDVHIGGVMKLKKSVGPARDGTNAEQEKEDERLMEEMNKRSMRPKKK